MRRTDLALEMQENINQGIEIEGVKVEQTKMAKGKLKFTQLEIINEQGEKVMGKARGSYYTIELMPGAELEAERILLEQLRGLTKGKDRRYLVMGLGNRLITPDALGPWVIDEIISTRHLKESEIWDKKWAEVGAIAPGVMAQTGMEIQEIVQGIVEETKPEFIIAVDALAAGNVCRMGNTIQITNTGICPGGGIGNARKELSKSTLGIDVIAVGVPTVVYAETIVRDYLYEMMKKSEGEECEIRTIINQLETDTMDSLVVTDKSVDQDVRRMSKLIANACNKFGGVLT